MVERQTAQTTMRALRPWARMRVENPALPGTPDVNYCEGAGLEGWIELKQEDEWPKRATTPLRIPHFTQHQRIWLEEGWEKGRSCWMLLQVGRQYLLFTGEVAAKIVGHATRAELEDAAVAVWNTKREVEENLKRCLSRRAT